MKRALKQTFKQKTMFIASSNFPTGFRAQWVRTITDKSCVATATFYYNADSNINNGARQISETDLLLFLNPTTDILHVQGLFCYYSGF